MLDRLDDTIVAISSAPGYGALGIVRLSGPRAISIADRMTHTATGGPLAETAASTRVEGEVVLEDECTLPAFFFVFRSPHSYTRQDMVEVYTIGAPPALQLVRRRAIDLGAVDAEGGEFTARAFLNGAMDLSKAEAVAGVIRAQSNTQLRAARKMMDGVLSQRILKARDELARLLALVEADIDFAEEPIDFIQPEILNEQITGVRRSLRSLAEQAPSVERFDGLPEILLFGAPNVGKSSLMNRLSGTRRAICAAVAGTTRDLLSAPINVGRGEAILLDAAGFDQSPGELNDDIRKLTQAAAQSADLLCLVVDAADVSSGGAPDLPGELGDTTGQPVVVAINKVDLIDASEMKQVEDRAKEWSVGPVTMVSALKGTGVETLRQQFAGSLGSSVATAPGEALIISDRQRSAILSATQSLARAAELAAEVKETVDSADLIAFELREALDELGAVTGQVTTEDLLGQIFADFCIGK